LTAFPIESQTSGILGFLSRELTPLVSGLPKTKSERALEKSDGVPALPTAEALPKTFLWVDGQARGVVGMKGTASFEGTAFTLEIVAVRLEKGEKRRQV